MKKIKNNINEDVWFTKNDIVKVPRSTFYRNQDKKLTFNAGKLVPLFVDEILPGDTYSLDMASVIRFSSPLIRPVMDDVEFEAWAFFVPARLLDDNWEKIIANYKENPDWTTDVDMTLSKLSIPSTGFAVQSVGDYFGLPTALEKTDKFQEFVSLLPFRGYTKIWDEYFRDQNLQKTITLEHPGYQALDGVATADGNYETDAQLGGALCPLNKKHDLFTSALPAPQKGAAPTIGIGGQVPLGGKMWDQSVYVQNEQTGLEVIYHKTYNIDSNQFREIYPQTTRNLEVNHSQSSPYHIAINGSIDPSGPTFAQMRYLTHGADLAQQTQLYADLSQVSGISVNDLRVLIQSQLLKEQDARYGSRYPEYLLGSWGVVSGDARLQRPEFLGKVAFSLNINQTVQTSGTNQESAQSNVSAYSLTGNQKHLLTKSFVEHGYIFVVGGVRIKNRTYNQRVDKMWSKFSRLDFYNPVFAHLGEQPIKNKEIHFAGSDKDDNGVFGYQEAYYEYRYLPNQVCGYMRPGIQESLAGWNYAENYNQTPTLSPEWIKEDTSAIDRTLAIPTATGANFIADIFFKNKATRPMPVHGNAGLIDHSGKIIL